ncbi:hypothetical protein D3C81_947090 [compost metagenome]
MKRSLPASISALLNVWLVATSFQVEPSRYCSLPSPGSWVIFTPRLVAGLSTSLTPKVDQPRISGVSSVPVTLTGAATGASLTATTLTVVVAVLE